MQEIGMQDFVVKGLALTIYGTGDADRIVIIRQVRLFGSGNRLTVVDHVTTVEVTCKDKSYSWLLHWITQKGARKTQKSVVPKIECSARAPSRESMPLPSHG